MAPRLIWAIPGFVAWVVLQVAAVQVCTGWREGKAKYGFGAVVLLLWWLPNFLMGEKGASEVEQGVLIAGFPIAAIYLSWLLIDEWIERGRVKADGKRVNADS